MPSSLSDQSDSDSDVAQWAGAARCGCQAAFARLYRRFLPLVHGILLARFRPALADELSQECFATAFARLAQLQDDRRFGAWIATIARRIQPARTGCEVAADDRWEPVSAETSPEDGAEASRLLRAVADLPEAYRETLMLRLVEGLSGPEIAALTGRTPDSVRVNLHRGMDKLRRSLGLAGAGTSREDRT
jgi:RNA polymerase sigma-70 factor (ECF subfamily)